MQINGEASNKGRGAVLPGQFIALLAFNTVKEILSGYGLVFYHENIRSKLLPSVNNPLKAMQECI